MRTVRYTGRELPKIDHFVLFHFPKNPAGVSPAIRIKIPAARLHHPAQCQGFILFLSRILNSRILWSLNSVKFLSCHDPVNISKIFDKIWQNGDEEHGEEERIVLVPAIQQQIKRVNNLFYISYILNTNFSGGRKKIYLTFPNKLQLNFDGL